MPKLEHYILTVPRRAEYGVVRKDPKGATDTFLVGEGKSFAGHLPADATVELDPKHKGMKLDDFINNTMQWLIVSEKVRALLADEPNRCEIYPLRVLDLKKRPVKAPYFLVHPVGTVDCVDLKRSEYTRSEFEPELVAGFRRLVLDAKRVPSDRTLFRIKENPRKYIIRSDLLDRLAEADVNGIEVLDLDTPVFI